MGLLRALRVWRNIQSKMAQHKINKKGILGSIITGLVVGVVVLSLLFAATWFIDKMDDIESQPLNDACIKEGHLAYTVVSGRTATDFISCITEDGDIKYIPKPN